MKKIVLFASGTGSNAENIILHFQNSPSIKVVAIFSNNPNAKVLDIAEKYKINSVVFNKTMLNDGFVLNELNKIAPDLIVLAGFLLKFPASILVNYPNKVINIHPALLPNYGGKGMYGMHVHQAVLDNKETETGITIHFVNENYDEGKFISQHKVSIKDCNSADAIAQKVLRLEHQYFSLAIEQLLEN